MNTELKRAFIGEGKTHLGGDIKQRAVTWTTKVLHAYAYRPDNWQMDRDESVKTLSGAVQF